MLDEFAVFARLVAPAFLGWLAWTILRAPYQDRSSQALIVFLALVSAGFAFEFLWEFLVPYSRPLSELSRGLERAVGYADPPVLLLYAGLFGRPRPWSRSRWLWSCYSLAALVLFILGLPYLSRQWIPRGGYPAFAWAETLYVNLTYLAAFLVVLDGYAKEERRHLSRQFFFLALGVGFIALSRSAAFVFAASPYAEDSKHWWSPPVPSLLVALSLLGAALATHLAIHGRHAGRIQRLGLVLALLLVVFFGVWSGLGVAHDEFGVRQFFAHYYGLRWVFFGVIVAYAILRYQLFDFELRARQATALLATLFAVPAVAMFAGVAAQGRGFDLGIARLWGLVAGAASALPLYVVFERAARFFVPPGTNPAREANRRLEVYEATLEHALRKPEWSAAEQRFADTLREVLGISAADHEKVMARLRRPPNPS